MKLQIIFYMNKLLKKIFPILLFFYLSNVRAQTYSNEEIVISGLGFSRFVVTLVPDKSFSKNLESGRWLRIIDRNLCWSGVFLVTDSKYQTCRNKNKSNADMKILIKLENKISKNDSLGSKHLILTIADNDGAPLFPLNLSLRNNRFREKELMNLINNISSKLTGLEGILGSTIAFTLKQPKRRKIIVWKAIY